eukprot:scaffold938_cov399-Prasinococcus_capsulatus_cf.AAC.10
MRSNPYLRKGRRIASGRILLTERAALPWQVAHMTSVRSDMSVTQIGSKLYVAGGCLGRQFLFCPGITGELLEFDTGTPPPGQRERFRTCAMMRLSQAHTPNVGCPWSRRIRPGALLGGGAGRVSAAGGDAGGRPAAGECANAALPARRRGGAQPLLRLALHPRHGRTHGGRPAADLRGRLRRHCQRLVDRGPLRRGPLRLGRPCHRRHRVRRGRLRRRVHRRAHSPRARHQCPRHPARVRGALHVWLRTALGRRRSIRSVRRTRR